MRARRLVSAAVCGALSGAAAWTVAGYLAIDTLASTPRIVGLLPSLPWLLVAAIVGAGAAMWTASRGTPPSLFLLPSIGAIGWVALSGWPALAAWAGPATIVPFALLMTGLAIASERRTPVASHNEEHQASTARWADSRWSPVLAAALAATWMGGVLWAVTPLSATGDEPHYLVATQSLLADGDVDLRNQYDTLSYRSFYPGILEPRHGVTGALGQEFPFHGLGISVLALPAFVLGGVPAVRVLMILIAAVGTGFFWSAARRFTGSTSSAWIAWLALASSAPFALQGILIYPDGVAAAIASLALWAIAAIVTPAPVGVRAMVGTGIALALVPWLHIRLASVAGVLGVTLLIALRQRHRDLMLPFMAAPIISFALWIASTWVMFRTIDPTAIFRQKAAGSLTAMPMGILGLLFDAEYGLFVYAPVAAIAALGVAATWNRSALVSASTTLLTMATLGVGGAWVWWGGDSTPARFLVPVLPLVFLWFAAWWTDRRAGARAFAGALIVLGACLTLLVAIAEHGLYLTNFPDGRGTLFEWISPNVDLTLAMPSLFRPGATPGTEAIVAALWVIAGGLAFLACGLSTHLRTVSRHATWLTASIALLAWLTLGASLGWWWHGVPAWTPDRGQLRLLHAATSPALDVAVRGPGPQVVSREDVLASLNITMPLPDATTMLHVPFVPAGRYVIDVESANNRAPTADDARDGSVGGAILSLELGRGALPFATWPARDTSLPPRFSLAAPVYAVRVVTQGSKDASGVVRLQPRAVDAPPLLPDVAQRVTHYGDLAVYSFDPYSYPETEGFWLAGDRSGRIAIADLDGRMSSAVMTVTAQDAPTTVTLSRGPFTRTLTLAPGATERVVVPREPEDTLVSFTVAGASSAQAPDGRRLGAFVRVSRE